MACKTCTEPTIQTMGWFKPYPDCKPSICGNNCQNPIDSSCVAYTGPALINSGAGTSICLENVLQSIDSKLAEVTQNYTGYDQACLPVSATQQDFVETISSYVCTTREELDLFTSQTFPDAIDVLDGQIQNISSPGITSCTYLGIQNTDTVKQVLQKLANGTCNINNQIDLSGANWSAFQLVGNNPKTPLQATNALIAQILAIQQAPIASLPTINNVSNCLGGTAIDSIVQTITLLTNRACISPTLNINTLTFGCISKPSNNNLDLQGTLQSMLNTLTTLVQNSYTFDTSSFSISQTNTGNLCLGKTVSLNSVNLPTDRYVAATATDTTPGTLIDKLVEGTGVILDFTDQTKCKISVDTTPIVSDGKVRSQASDPTTGYLGDKIKGTGGSGITVQTFVDNTDQRVNVMATLNIATLTQLILEEIQNDTDGTLKTLLCSLVNACPSTCAAPTDAQVTFTT